MQPGVIKTGSGMPEPLVLHVCDRDARVHLKCLNEAEQAACQAVVLNGTETLKSLVAGQIHLIVCCNDRNFPMNSIFPAIVK